MKVIRTVAELREARRALEGTVSFVPTMGALHDAHGALMREAKDNADHLIVSIFVNPTQFDRASDLESYPRDEEADLEGCRQAGASIVFMPPPHEMYRDGRSQLTRVEVSGLTDTLCGRTRTGHFEGVATVVSKLFNIVQPDVAAFGQKDYQQLAVIQRMTEDLNFPIRILGVATGRNADGLAISSRNRNLTATGRVRALSISRGLKKAHAAFVAGERRGAALTRVLSDEVEHEGLRIDYVECVHPTTLTLLDTVAADGAVLAIAAFEGEVRLIDNLRLDEELPELLR